MATPPCHPLAFVIAEEDREQVADQTAQLLVKTSGRLAQNARYY